MFLKFFCQFVCMSAQRSADGPQLQYASFWVVSREVNFLRKRNKNLFLAKWNLIHYVEMCQTHQPAEMNAEFKLLNEPL